jgi:GntP family gluconate:H+ symporter
MLLNLSILLVLLFLLIFSISKWKVHPFIALVIIALAMGISMGLGGKQTVSVLLKGFGETLQWIAIIIILGAFIGEVLQETGGAFRIADRIVKWVGEKKLPWAMGLTGYLVSIPVFIDVAYILFQPVTESLSVKSRRPVLYIGLSLAAGLTVSHTLIPPTPGPMAVASLLDVEMGKMLLINLIVAIFAMAGGILWVIFFVKGSWIDYDQKLKDASPPLENEISIKSSPALQNMVLDVLPILAPIILIGLGSFVSFESENIASKVFSFISTPLAAVLVGAMIAVLHLGSRNKRSTVNRLTEQAIVKSALVIMITGAGGSLGYVIRETGIQDDIVLIFANYPFLGIMLPFIVASLLTISTGSITVSLVGTASMLGPMASSLPVSPEMVAALIGCGSLVPPKVLYRTYTIQSLVMGISGLAGVFVLRLAGFQ